MGADDFQGTSPGGSLYSKKEAVAHAESGVPEEGCTLYEVRVHFFGDAMAILYGSESAAHPPVRARSASFTFATATLPTVPSSRCGKFGNSSATTAASTIAGPSTANAA